MIKNKVVHYSLGYLIGGTLFLIGIPLAMSAITEHFWSFMNFAILNEEKLTIAIALFLIIIGLLLALWSIVEHNKIGKGGPAEFFNIEISPKTKNLVVTGPYHYTRNPMLLGTCVYYSGISIYLNSYIALALTLVFIVAMLAYIKKFEEGRLIKEFGEAYLTYSKKVPIFFPSLDAIVKKLK